MTSEKTIEAHYERERLRRKAAARPPADGATPQQKLVRAAETGRFEATVAAAQPAEPPKMMTPEEREAELRRAGAWPSSSSAVAPRRPERSRGTPFCGSPLERDPSASLGMTDSPARRTGED
jgi:hypothetical protein